MLKAPHPPILYIFVDKRYIQNFASLEAIKLVRLLLTVFQSIFDS